MGGPTKLHSTGQSGYSQRRCTYHSSLTQQEETQAALQSIPPAASELASQQTCQHSHEIPLRVHQGGSCTLQLEAFLPGADIFLSLPCSKTSGSQKVKTVSDIYYQHYSYFVQPHGSLCCHTTQLPYTSFRLTSTVESTERSRDGFHLKGLAPEGLPQIPVRM